MTATVHRTLVPGVIQAHHGVRSIAFLSLLLLAGVGPWWLPLIGASIALILWGAYEVVLVGCYLDILVASPVVLPFGGFTCTIVLLGVFFVAYVVRRAFRERLSL